MSYPSSSCCPHLRLPGPMPEDYSASHRLCQAPRLGWGHDVTTETEPVIIERTKSQLRCQQDEMTRRGKLWALTKKAQGARDLEQRHLQRLLTVDGLGLLLGAVALGIRIEVGFGTAFLLGLLAILGLSRAIRSIGGESD